MIFERVKEEIRGGRSIVAGIATGYKRGFAAIVDANVVTFMTAFILFALATAEVKGFAFTLGIGTLLTLFTAVLATQAALGTMGRSRFVSHPAALGAARRGSGWTFDFMGASKWFFSLSGTILLIGALAIGGKGLNFGIDFKSGTRIQTAFIRPVTENEVASVMSAAGYPDAEVQKFVNKSVGGTGYQISHQDAGTGRGREESTPASIRSSANGPSVPGTRNFSSTSIGPTFGKTVANSAVIAIIASLLVISAYIALRFEWKYAVPVLIALMHDLLITAGVYSLTGREVTTATVAALLTILGYSLYDTIIVFDRVRENVPRMPRAAFSQIVNRSMSEVLTRSLATSFCTLLPVLALLFFGGETLKDFAFALMVGIASGAYSSIFIASPGADALEGARAGLPPTGARGSCANSARCRPTRRGRGRARGRGARAEAQAHPPREPRRPGGARRADLKRRVPGTRARPRRRGRGRRRSRPRSKGSRQEIGRRTARAPASRSGHPRRSPRRMPRSIATGPSRRSGGRPDPRGPRAQGPAQTREAQAPAQPPPRKVAMMRACSRT